MSGLSVSFEKRLGDFCLSPEFEAGEEIVVLLGPSGSGKTLTLRALAGLLTPDSGRIVLPGGPVFSSTEGRNVPAWQRDVGYVVQNLALFPHLTVAQNLGFSLQDRSPETRRHRVEELIQELGLQGLASRTPAALSGGQQQRVALGRALAAHPKVLLLDEPFSALDTPLRAQLRRQLMKLQRATGLPTLFVTHDLTEAYAIADQLAVFDEGRVLQFGQRAEVFGRPNSVRVAELLDARNIFPGHVVAIDQDCLEIETDSFRAKAGRDGDYTIGDRVAVCIRPEHVYLFNSQEAMPSTDTILNVVIEEIVSAAGSHRLYTSLAEASAALTTGIEVDVSDRAFEELKIGVGQRWRVVLALPKSVAIRL